MPKIKALSRPLRVALPCVGVDGCGHALAHLDVKVISCNVYDLGDRYNKYLTQHFDGDVETLRLGKLEGDLTKVTLDQLTSPVDLICAGPPCPPWAGNGHKKGVFDARSSVCVAVVSWMAAFIKSAYLIAAVLENVSGMLHNVGGRESFMARVLAVLQTEVTEFCWDVVCMDAKDYRLVQTRGRVFLRGLRKSFGSNVPPALPPFRSLPSKEFLDPVMPAVDRTTLTDTMKAEPSGRSKHDQKRFRQRQHQS